MLHNSANTCHYTNIFLHIMKPLLMPLSILYCICNLISIIMWNISSENLQSFTLQFCNCYTSNLFHKPIFSHNNIITHVHYNPYKSSLLYKLRRNRREITIMFNYYCKQNINENSESTAIVTHEVLCKPRPAPGFIFLT